MLTIFIMEKVLIFGCRNMRYLDIDQKKSYLFLKRPLFRKKSVLSHPYLFYLLEVKLEHACTNCNTFLVSLGNPCLKIPISSCCSKLL